LRELERREQQQKIVAELGKSALGRADLTSLFDRAVRQIAETLGNEYCKVLQLLPGGKELLLVAGVGWKKGLVGKATVAANSASHAGYTLQTSDPVVVEDLSQDKRIRGPQMLIDHGVTSGISVVIGPLDEPWGVLGTHSKERKHFSPDDVNFIRAVAHVLWAAIDREYAERELSQSTERLRVALKAGRMGTWDWDLVTDEGVWSDREFELLDVDPAEGDTSGERFFSQVHPEDRPRLQAAVNHCMEHGDHYEQEFRVIRRDGSIRWLTGQGEVIRDDEGKTLRMIGVNFDITERKENEEKIKRLNESLEQQVADRVELMRVLHDVAVIANQAPGVDAAFLGAMGRICQYNHWMLGHVFRLTADASGRIAPTGMWHVSEEFSPDPEKLAEFQQSTDRITLAKGEAMVGRVLASGQPFGIDDFGRFDDWRRSDPRELGLHSAIAFAVLVDHEVVAVLEFYSNQPIHREQPFMEIMTSIGIELGHVLERERLERAVVEAAVEEQRRLGSELHDSVLQEVTGISMLTESLRRRLAESGLPETEVAEQLVEYLRNTQDQIRRLSRGLVPVEIDAEGLMAALEELVESTEEIHDVPCVFDCPQRVVVENSEVATQLYRIAQEAVQNAIKHGRPQNITVSLTEKDGTVILKIHNDGELLPETGERRDGAGLRIMRYRAGLIGARLQIESQQDKGVLVTCRVRRVESGVSRVESREPIAH